MESPRIITFGNVHELFRDWIAKGVFEFDGEIDEGRKDDLDKVLFRFLDIYPKSYEGPSRMLAWLDETDRLLDGRNLKWLYSQHGLTLVKAILVQKGITELRW